MGLYRELLTVAIHVHVLYLSGTCFTIIHIITFCCDSVMYKDVVNRGRHAGKTVWGTGSPLISGIDINPRTWPYMTCHKIKK